MLILNPSRYKREGTEEECKYPKIICLYSPSLKRKSPQGEGVVCSYRIAINRATRGELLRLQKTYFFESTSSSRGGM